MRKFVALLVAIVGFALIGWSVTSYYPKKKLVYGYHPMYPALLGIALFTGGLIGRQE